MFELAKIVNALDRAVSVISVISHDVSIIRSTYIFLLSVFMYKMIKDGCRFWARGPMEGKVNLFTVLN
jgi:hypothetical protein